MGLTRTRGTIRKYDDKECWEKYMDWGAAASHKKLRGWLQERGTSTSPMGPFFAMWRHAIRNPEETYPQYRKWFFETASQEGSDGNVTFEEYLLDLKKHGRMRSLLSKSAFAEFCEKYNLD